MKFCKSVFVCSLAVLNIEASALSCHLTQICQDPSCQMKPNKKTLRENDDLLEQPRKKPRKNKKTQSALESSETEAMSLVAAEPRVGQAVEPVENKDSILVETCLENIKINEDLGYNSSILKEAQSRRIRMRELFNNAYFKDLFQSSLKCFDLSSNRSGKFIEPIVKKFLTKFYENLGTSVKKYVNKNKINLAIPITIAAINEDENDAVFAMFLNDNDVNESIARSQERSLIFNDDQIDLVKDGVESHSEDAKQRKDSNQIYYVLKKPNTKLNINLAIRRDLLSDLDQMDQWVGASSKNYRFIISKGATSPISYLSYETRAEICSQRGNHFETPYERWLDYFYENETGQARKKRSNGRKPVEKTFPAALSDGNAFIYSLGGFVKEVSSRLRAREIDFGYFVETKLAIPLHRRLCGTFSIKVLPEVLSFLNSYDQEQSSSQLKKWRILDPSSGWGDRMVSAWKSSDQVQSYVGIDPNPYLPGLYLRMYCKAKKAVGENSDQRCLENGSKAYIAGTSVPIEVRGDVFNFDFRIPTTIYQAKAEEFDYSILENHRPNLVITSPPYFDTEMYQKETRENLPEIFKSQIGWVKEFLANGVPKQADILSRGGFLVYNVSDEPPASDTHRLKDYRSQAVSLSEAFNQVLLQCCSKSMEYVGWMGTGGDAVQPIWIWRKKNDEKCSPECKDKDWSAILGSQGIATGE